MNLKLVNIKQLVTVSSEFNAPPKKRFRTGAAMRNLGVIENAAVVIQKGRISWLGKMSMLKKSYEGIDEFDCAGKVVIPGFVDSHTHLVFGGSREDEFAMRSAGATYQEIAEKGGGILSTVTKTREASKKDLKKSARKYLHSILKKKMVEREI